MLFNAACPTVMHVDINSCFATIEQQANLFLRGKPVAVAAYTTSSGCILAPSIEAKRYGIKTGMRVYEGRALFPDLIVIPSDPNKYRHVHLELRNILSRYTDDFYPKSIDEFVLNLTKSHCLRKMSMNQIGEEIKNRIRTEIGEWISVSIGIGASRFLAKTAAGLKKPDGMETIDVNNFEKIYKNMSLTDLHGINIRNEIRLKNVGISSVWEMYCADLPALKAAFRSVLGFYWFARIRGWEIDNVEFGRRSYGNSYSIPERLTTPRQLSPVLAKLVNKAARRMRNSGYMAYGVNVGASYKRAHFWNKSEINKTPLFDTRDIFEKAFNILSKSPGEEPVHTLAVSLYGIVKGAPPQLELFRDTIKKVNITAAMDKLNKRWGDYTLVTANTFPARGAVPDRIAFGGIKELEEFTLG